MPTVQCKFCSSPLYLKENTLEEQKIECIGCHTNTMEFIDFPVCKVTMKRFTYKISSSVLIDNLEELKTSTVSLTYCKKCDGVLIAEEEFEKLINYKVNPQSKLNPYYLRFIQDHPRDNRKKSQVHPCPICQEKMSLFNYKKQSGIILDICEEHGIWLDGGELQQIVEWYAVGGDKKEVK